MGDLRVGALGPGSSARATMTLRHDLDEPARAIAYTVTFQPQLGQYMAGDVFLEVSAVDDSCDCSARTSVPLPPPPLPPAPGQPPPLPPPPVTVTFTLFGALAPGIIRVTPALVIPPLTSQPPGAMATGQVTGIRGEVS
jgi:hypothetical protein